MTLVSYPLVVLALSFVTFWLSALLGALVLKRYSAFDGGTREEFGLIVGATLTLLGLLIGFSFSMAISRYELRTAYEEAEANAIGTEYLRAELLPAADAARVRALLAEYLDQRVFFYTSRDRQQLRHVDAYTAQLQDRLWSAIRTPATTQPSPPIQALVISGMNDVLNSQGNTQAAWWNHIPFAAWILMAAIAVFSNLLVGYGARPVRTKPYLLMVLPLVVSVALYLIADLDSPRSGIIGVQPQNLLSLSQSLRTH